MAETGSSIPEQLAHGAKIVTVGDAFTELAARAQTPELLTALPAVPLPVRPLATESPQAVDIGLGLPRAPSVVWTGERIFSHEAIGATKESAVKWLLVIFGSVQGVGKGNEEQEKKVLSAQILNRAIQQLEAKKNLTGGAISEADWQELQNVARGLFWIHNTHSAFLRSEGNTKKFLEEIFAGEETPPFKDDFIQAVIKNCPGTADGYTYSRNLLPTWQANAQVARTADENDHQWEPWKQHRGMNVAARRAGWGNSVMANYQWEMGMKFLEVFGEVAIYNRRGPDGLVGWWKSGGDDPIQAVLYPWRFPALIRGTLPQEGLAQMFEISRRFKVSTYLSEEVAGEDPIARLRAGQKPQKITPDSNPVRLEPISYPAWLKAFKRANDAWEASMKALSNPDELIKAAPAIANHARAGTSPADLDDRFIRPVSPSLERKRCAIFGEVTALSFFNFRALTNIDTVREYMKKQLGDRKFYEKFHKGIEFGNYPKNWNETKVMVGGRESSVYALIWAMQNQEDVGEWARSLLQSGGEILGLLGETVGSATGIPLAPKKK